MIKTWLILIAGATKAECSREVMAEPGATPNDILRALDLHDYCLTLDRSNQYLVLDQPCFDTLPDGAKLSAWPRSHAD